MNPLVSFGACLVLMGSLARAETAPDVLNYSIPVDAVKVGPGHSRDPSQTYFNFFAPSSTPSPNTLIGRETYSDGRLVERELYKDGRRHGVWCKWHQNGVLASEAPYSNGAMHGTFKHWTEAGGLIGRYEMVNGDGVKKIYSALGELAREQTISYSRPNGISMEYFVNDGTRSLVWQKDGNNVGNAFSFYPTGSVMGITCYSNEGGLHGPHLKFSPTGLLIKKAWYVRGNVVAEADYAAAASRDLSLPAYFADAVAYQQFVDGSIKALVEKYRTMLRVKIPLEFDEQGNPVPAVVQ